MSSTSSAMTRLLAWSQKLSSTSWKMKGSPSCRTLLKSHFVSAGGGVDGTEDVMHV